MPPPNGGNSTFVIQGSPPPGGGGFMVPGNNTGGPFGQGNDNFTLPENSNSTWMAGPSMTSQSHQTQSLGSNTPIFISGIAIAAVIGVTGGFLLVRKRKNQSAFVPPPPDDTSDSEVWQDD